MKKRLWIALGVVALAVLLLPAFGCGNSDILIPNPTPPTSNWGTLRWDEGTWE